MKKKPSLTYISSQKRKIEIGLRYVTTFTKNIINKIKTLQKIKVRDHSRKACDSNKFITKALYDDNDDTSFFLNKITVVVKNRYVCCGVLL